MGDDLEQIRARRMAELQAQHGGGPGGDDERREQMERQNDMKNNILSQVLSQEARGRLSTIAAAKPEKAAMLESMIIRMVQTGQIGGKLSEKDLIGFLEKVSEQTSKKTTVKFDRRRAGLDSDDDDY